MDMDVDIVIETLSAAPRSPYDTQTFRIHYKSFPDFISDPSHCVMDPQL